MHGASTVAGGSEAAISTRAHRCGSGRSKHIVSALSCEKDCGMIRVQLEVSYQPSEVTASDSSVSADSCSLHVLITSL
jgi:hypothetical protein